MSPSRARTVHASAAQWARIRERAEAAEMTTSAFLVACARHEETRESGPAAPAQAQESHRLALTAREQHEMHEGLVRMDACIRALMEHLPEVEMNVLEGLAFVQRCHQQVAEERKRLVGMDGEHLA